MVRYWQAWTPVRKLANIPTTPAEVIAGMQDLQVRNRHLLSVLFSSWIGQAKKSRERPLIAIWLSTFHPVFLWIKWWLAGVAGSGAPILRSREALLEWATKSVSVDGAWLEFGVYQGASINLLARLATGTVYGFDSFEGLPATWNPGFAKGDLSMRGSLPPCETNVVLFRGWFSQTLPAFLRSHAPLKVAFLHIDCDLYSSTSQVFSHLSSNLVRGTIVVFDEYCSSLAVDDEARAFREFVAKGNRRFHFIGLSAQGSVAVKIVE